MRVKGFLAVIANSSHFQRAISALANELQEEISDIFTLIKSLALIMLSMAR